MSTRDHEQAEVPGASRSIAVDTAVEPGPLSARQRRDWPLGLLPGLVALFAFAPALKNGFVNWDDIFNVTANPDFRGLGWPQLRWAWTTFHLGVYQPLAW